jgi:hypothetical protein
LCIELFNRRAYLFRTVVHIIPHQVTGQANFVRKMSRRFSDSVRRAYVGCQMLQPDSTPIQIAFRPRCYLANNRGRVAHSGRMIQWRFQQFEMPIVMVRISAICRLRGPWIGLDQPAGKTHYLFLSFSELRLLFRI